MAGGEWVFTDPFSAGDPRGHFGINPSSRPVVICFPSEPPLPLHPTQRRPWPHRVLSRGSIEQQAFAREKLLFLEFSPPRGKGFRACSCKSAVTGAKRASTRHCQSRTMKTPRFSARQPCRQQPGLLPRPRRLAAGARSHGPVHVCGEGRSRRRHRRPAAAHTLFLFQDRLRCYQDARRRRRQRRSRGRLVTCSSVQPCHGVCALSLRPYWRAHVRACAPGGARGWRARGRVPGKQAGRAARGARQVTSGCPLSLGRADSHPTSPPGPCGLRRRAPRPVLARSPGPGATSPPRLPAIMLAVREAPAQRRMAGAPARAIWSALFKEEGTKLDGACECCLV